MKEFRYIILAIAIGLCSTMLAGNSENALAQNTTYMPGEKLVYSLSYGFITGGECELSVSEAKIEGKQVNHIVLKGSTVGIVDAIYKVRDQYESYVDPINNLPVKSVRSIKEGKYRYYNEVTYNRDSSQVISQKSGTHVVPENIQDILSAFYLARKDHFNDNMKKGDIIEIMTYFADELFPLRIRYKGTETIKTSFGKVSCYKFSPVTEVGRAFKTEDDMSVWVTKDANCIPVKVKFDLSVGSFICSLEKFSGLANPFSSIKF